MAGGGEGGSASILDNRASPKVGEWLRGHIKPRADLSIVSAYFTIYGFEALQGNLESAKSTRFLFGDPKNVGDVDPSLGEKKSFKFKKGQLRADNFLAQKALAKECEKWVKKTSTEIRTIRKGSLLHGKMYHARDKSGAAALMGSSNFTKSGLGEGAGGNLELNLATEPATTAQLENWFNKLWRNEKAVEDAKEEVLAALRLMGEDQTPQFIYYKTLYHIFERRLAESEAGEERAGVLNLNQSQIWKKLYEFQQQGVKGALNRLLDHNGCIIADSVGLGKTFEALAIIKFFELRNENVLVLCPKRLRGNWTRFTAAAANRNNPLAKDGFRYHVLSHTDLGRESGQVGDINLENFNWGNYSLLVIDESHNFRNAPAERRGKDGQVRRTRYDILLKDVIQTGVPTKVLLLSATPVNNTLNDLLNQINLISAKEDHAFAVSLEVPSVERTLRNAQREFVAWQKQRGEKSKEALLEKFPPGFFRLLDGLSVARSRRHIEKFYADFVQKNGGFPQRELPQNERPETGLDYTDIADRIDGFKLALYHPSDYVKTNSQAQKDLDTEKAERNYNQYDRERFLIGMMKVNFLKRLESSVFAFGETLRRTLEKIDRLDAKITNWQARQNAEETLAEEDVMPSDVDVEEAEDFVGSPLKKYHLADLELDKWLKELREEREVLRKIYDIALKVGVERDGKFNKLREILDKKIKSPPQNKRGEKNRKAIVFTTFADTAGYVYSHLQKWAEKNKVRIAKVEGGMKDFERTLDNFAPVARERRTPDENIDILIATDCISEGQNLQDCDTVINYDVHWNPVRIIQRFGRVDRLGSPNKKVRMVNFWPPMTLDDYIRLYKRVHERMQIVDIAATGQENLLKPEDAQKAGQLEFDFRAKQMRRIEKEVLDLEQTNEDGLTMDELTMDEFLEELLAYFEANKGKLTKAPLGLFAVAGKKEKQGGIVFCFRRQQKEGAKKDAPPLPCRLAYVENDGTIRALERNALKDMRALARDEDKVQRQLAARFDREIDNGRNMERISELAQKAFAALQQRERREEAARLREGGDLFSRDERKAGLDDYELVTWLVVK